MKRYAGILMIMAALILIAGCAAGPNDLEKTPDADGEVAGFWLGLWQGIISPITFIVSLFSDNVHLYEVHNNGGWYNFGFLLGVSIIFGGCGGGGACSRKSRRRKGW
jgi:hypothetical protein